MKKVVHLITTINRGGAENQLLTLVREQLKLGYSVEVLPLKGEPELIREFYSIGATVNLSLFNLNPIRQVFAIRKTISDKNVILHSHLPRAELLSLFSGKTMVRVVSRHNAEPFFPGAPKLISNYLSRQVLRRTHKCIAISKAVEKFMRQHHEVPSGQEIQVVHYGYGSEEPLPVERKEHKSADNFVIGTIARLVPQKDLVTLLQAFTLLNQGQTKYPYKLQIIGEGKLEVELMKLASDLGQSDKISWIGKTRDVDSYLEKWDLFVLTSLYEGFGLVLLEAMSHGIPIVAANNSAIPEVLGADYEFLFETSNALDLKGKICGIISSKKNFREFSQHRLQLFRPELMAHKIDQIYFI